MRSHTEYLIPDALSHGLVGG